jgi:hypothetical protein
MSGATRLQTWLRDTVSAAGAPSTWIMQLRLSKIPMALLFFFFFFFLVIACLAFFYIIFVLTYNSGKKKEKIWERDWGRY